MKINYMSDLHTEFDRGNSPLVTNGGEILLLAGDISIGGNVDWLLSQAHKYKHTLLIDGNHEFYHGDIDNTHREISQQLTDPSIQYLEGEIAEIDGQRFLGTTLWGSYGDADNLAIMAANQGMNDHRIITKDGRTFVAEEALALNVENTKWLAANIQEGDIVLTHHAPSKKSVDLSRYGDIPLNGAYHSNLEELIIKSKPSLWFHGHIHTSRDYTIGDTRILCNPRGYVNHEENAAFDIKATVEIP